MLNLLIFLLKLNSEFPEQIENYIKNAVEEFEDSPCFFGAYRGEYR